MKPTPQRKPNKVMSAMELLRKGVTGSAKAKSSVQSLEEQANKIINGK